MPEGEVGAGQVHLDRRSPLVCIEVEHRAGPGDADVAVHDVRYAELGDGLLEHSLHVGVHGDVGLHCHGGSTVGGDPCRDSRGLIGVPVDGDNGGAGMCVAHGGGLSVAESVATRPGAEDDDDLVLQVERGHRGLTCAACWVGR